MTRIALVVSDVDGTLVTQDKRLTDGARRAVQRLHDAGIGFTITSSRPAGRHALPDRAARRSRCRSGRSTAARSSIPQLKPIEQHLIPAAAAQRSLDVLTEFGVDIWLFTNEQWIIRRDDGKYVPHERDTIKLDPTFAR